MGKLLVHSFLPRAEEASRALEASYVEGPHPAMAVGTTDTHPPARGEEGAMDFRIKSKIFLAFRYAGPKTLAEGGAALEV